MRRIFVALLKANRDASVSAKAGFTLADPSLRSGCVSRFASRLTGSMRTNEKGFTLVEILIVIAILAILAAAVVIVINPSEMLAQARDAERITGIESLKKSIDLYTVDNSTGPFGVSQTVYISIPDTSATCANIVGLPTLPVLWSYNCVTAANLRNTNGTGWIPLDFNTIKGGSLIPYLPIDPQNDQALGKYYSYIPGGSYVLTALMESEKQTKVAAKDGGTDAGRIEAGSDLNLWRTASGLVAYWPLDGNGTVTSGITAGFQDFSGNNNNGSAENANGTGMSFIPGKFSGALQLDGIDDDVRINSSPVFNLAATNHTFSVWIKTSAPPIDSPGIIMRRFSGGTPGSGYHLAMNTSGKMIIEMRADGGDNPNPITPLTYTDGNWHMYTVTAEPAAKMVRQYVDGNMVASDSYLGNILDSTDAFYIGGSGGSYNFLGSVDDLRVYKRMLSDSEIKAMYNAGK